MNTQPVEKQVKREDGLLDVVSIFDTIQGEGPFAGTPAVFIRMAGCNLSSTCRGCDTDYTSGRHMTVVKGILNAVSIHKRKLVVLTGGEPFRQEIGPLCSDLLLNGYKVQIETNGTLWNPGMPGGVHITCSPKTSQINKQVRNRVRSWKYIVEEGKIDPTDGLPTSSLGGLTPPYRPFAGVSRDSIFIQPFDSGDNTRNRANLEAAVQTCLQHGYRLSLQMHKIVNLP